VVKFSRQKRESHFGVQKQKRGLSLSICGDE